LKWFVSTIEGAGLKRIGAGPVFLFILALTILVGLLSAGATGISAFGFFLSLGALAFQLEAISLLATARRRRMARLWPEVIDSFHSAIVSGLSLSEAFDDLAIDGPTPVRHYFRDVTNMLDSGITMEVAIDNLKSNIGEVHADKFCEVLRLANDSGAESLAASLAHQSQNLRNDLALAGQLEAKQSWVVGTAKMAVTAPWIVVALLSVRSENTQVYNSPLGSQILFAGFIICVVAYRLVNSLGAIPHQPRMLLK
jgi:tight adherence protein B